MKKEYKRRGKLVANTEKQEGNKPKQSHGGCGKFDEIMNKMCENHGFSVNHLLGTVRPTSTRSFKPARKSQRVAT
jgi:hypothetical protein